MKVAEFLGEARMYGMGWDFGGKSMSTQVGGHPQSDLYFSS